MFLSDNGSQFTGRELGRYLREIGVRQQFTAPYCPQENPTERANRTLKTMLAQVCQNQHNKCNEFLPEINLAMNSCISETTGHSPAYIIQCREPRLPNILYDEVTNGTGTTGKSSEERAEELRDVFKMVRQRIGQAGEQQRRYYNLRRRQWKPAVGDWVWVRQHPLSKAIESFAAKLAPKYDGPYEVMGYTSPVIVNVRGQQRNDVRRAHLSELKPFASAETSSSGRVNAPVLEAATNTFSVVSSSGVKKSLDGNMENRSPVLKTKAYYKQQWQNQEDEVTPTSSKRICQGVPGVTQPNPVRLGRTTIGDVPRPVAIVRPFRVQRRPSSLDIIEISDEENAANPGFMWPPVNGSFAPNTDDQPTPPRPRHGSANSPTPPQIMSPGSSIIILDEDSLSSVTSHESLPAPIMSPGSSIITLEEESLPEVIPTSIVSQSEAS